MTLLSVHLPDTDDTVGLWVSQARRESETARCHSGVVIRLCPVARLSAVYQNPGRKKKSQNYVHVDVQAKYPNTN